MKQIPLTRGLFALVDDEDFEFLNQWKWHAKKYNNSKFYACRSAKRVNRKVKTIMMHRVILNISNPKDFCDHKDGNGLNNQRQNLRLSTRAQNGQNRGAPKNNKVGYKGVSYRGENKWLASIRINGKTKHLGLFSCPKLAALAYDEAAKTNFKEFAKTNF